MNIFRVLTPISYWILIITWSFILFFYLRRLKASRIESKLFTTLLIILSIDAFRTLFESAYFGAWYTSLVGIIPLYIHDFLIQPFNVFIPKFLNVIAAVLVLTILIRHWMPQEEEERKNQSEYMQRLEKEIEERRRIQKENEKLIVDLKDAFAKMKTLKGLLPICSSCKKIRDDSGYWEQLEIYIQEHSEADFTHGICPDCFKELYPQMSDKVLGKDPACQKHSSKALGGI